jgi:hypothetical protein
MRNSLLLKAAVVCFALAFASLVVWYSASGQAATQTDNWCPELGEILSGWGVYHDWTGKRDLTDAEIALLQDMDTSDYVTAQYGDPANPHDNYWDGAPRDFFTYAQLWVTTTEGERIIGLNSSASEPGVAFVVALLSRTVSGEGERRGMHDICAVFVTTREAVDAVWAQRVSVDE